MVRSVCLIPVSFATWCLHTLWRFTVPAYMYTTGPYSRKRNNYNPGISLTTQTWFNYLLFCKFNYTSSKWQIKLVEALKVAKNLYFTMFSFTIPFRKQQEKLKRLSLSFWWIKVIPLSRIMTFFQFNSILSVSISQTQPLETAKKWTLFEPLEILLTHTWVVTESRPWKYCGDSDT